MSKKSKKRKQAKNIARKQDPTYMVKQSELKAHIDRLLKTDPSVQQSIHEEARRINLAEAKKQDLDIVTLILYALHKSEKYGKKRLLRFVSKFDYLQKYYEGFYKDCDMYAMRKHLKEWTGLDVERLDEEVAEYVKENSTEG